MTGHTHDGADPQSPARHCWCGNQRLDAFSDHYRVCRQCETVISTFMHARDISRVESEDADLYGREYWFSHMANDFGFATIDRRARTDLIERHPHWLQTVLKYASPGDRVLELGSAHGGFVAMLRWAGFDATGLELSPAIVALARSLFDVPLLQGPIEEQHLVPGSVDLIVLMDVMEHLPNPVDTMRCCLDALSPGGRLLIQTPCYPEGARLDELRSHARRFVEYLVEKEHLYLFSRRSIAQLFAGLGCPYLAFERPLFGECDMFVAVSRQPIVARDLAQQEHALASAPVGRLTQATIDLFTRLQESEARYQAADADRAARLAMVEDLHRRLTQADADRTRRLEMIGGLEQQLSAAEIDRASRLEMIGRLEQRLAAADADRAGRLEMIEQLEAQLVASESDRANRLAEMKKLEALLKESETDRAGRLAEIYRVSALLDALDPTRSHQ